MKSQKNNLYPALNRYLLNLFNLQFIRHQRTFTLLCLLSLISISVLILNISTGTPPAPIQIIIPILTIPAILIFRSKFGIPQNPNQKEPPKLQNPSTEDQSPQTIDITLTLSPSLIRCLKKAQVDPQDPDSLQEYLTYILARESTKEMKPN